jgi:Tol biopolymer transport system component
LCILIVLLTASCGSGGGPGLILSLVQDEDEPGRFESRVLILDATGRQVDEIRLPGEPVLPGPFSTQVSNQALVRTGEDGWVLVDTAKGRAEELDIPVDVSADLIPNPGGFAQSGGKRHLILGSPRGDAAYLVDLEDGEVTDLLDIDRDMVYSFAGWFSPDEEHLALFTADGLWLVPTADPDDARRLGDGQTTGAISFSRDSKQIAFVQRDEDEFQVVVEQANGSDSEVADDGEWFQHVSFVPGQQQLVLVREEEVSLLSLRDGREHELLEFEGRPVARPWFSPNGRMMLFGYDGDDENVWHLIDLKEGSADELGRLEGYTPELTNPEHRWVFFRDDLSIGAGIDFAALDLETGEVQRIRGLDDETMLFFMTDRSTDGGLGLVTGQTDEGLQAWLLDAKEGQARLLVEGWLSGGSLSTDGRWYAYSSRDDREDLEFELMLLEIEKDETRSLGKGMRPIWVRP